MKKIILLLLILQFGIANVIGQCAKYDGDWTYTYEGIGSPKVNGYPDPNVVGRGTGKVFYRIKTIEGKTTIRIKERYPLWTDFEYSEGIVTSCNENSLDWYSKRNEYWDEDNNQRILIYYYCSLQYKSGTLFAHSYSIQNFYNSGGTLVNSMKYNEQMFTLYKDDDW